MGAIFKNGKMYAGGIENVIETVKVNGTALAVESKTVDITIPTTLPADGGNADTVNKGFWATPFDRAVMLQWNAIIDDTVTKYRIQKLVYNETDAKEVWTTISYPDATATSYCDEDLENGTVYNYRLLYHDADDAYHTVADISACPIAVNINADLLNDKTADTIISEARTPVVTYTYIVDSNQKLLDWANNVEGNDYTHVLVKRGTWEMSIPDGVNLTNTGTKTVTGEAGNLIKNVCKVEGNIYVLRHTNLPVTNDCFVRDINVYAENTYSGYNGTTPAYSVGVGFGYIRNLINCTSTGYAIGYATSFGCIRGFYSCHNLVSCRANPIGGDETKTFHYGFHSCEHLTNCEIRQTREDGGVFLTYGFHGCKHLNNCHVTAFGKNNSGGYYNCNYLNNCYSYTSGEAAKSTSTSYYNCNHLTTCYAFGSAECQVTYNRCSYLIDCYAHTAGSYNMVGFSTCNNLTRCHAHFTNVNGGISGFKNCTGVQSCYVDVDTFNSGGYSPYSNSSANQGDYNATYVCANTPEGGWNSYEVSTFNT